MITTRDKRGRHCLPPINHAGILVLSIEAFVANKFDVFVTGGTGYMGSRLISTLVGCVESAKRRGLVTLDQMVRAIRRRSGG